jgi:hypothetical protein
MLILYAPTFLRGETNQNKNQGHEGKRGVIRKLEVKRKRGKEKGRDMKE